MLSGLPVVAVGRGRCQKVLLDGGLTWLRRLAVQGGEAEQTHPARDMQGVLILWLYLCMFTSPKLPSYFRTENVLGTQTWNWQVN